MPLNFTFISKIFATVLCKNKKCNGIIYYILLTCSDTTEYWYQDSSRNVQCIVKKQIGNPRVLLFTVGVRGPEQVTAAL